MRVALLQVVEIVDYFRTDFTCTAEHRAWREAKARGYQEGSLLVGAKLQRLLSDLKAREWPRP